MDQTTAVAGSDIHNLYEVLVVFVIFCGAAAILLFALATLIKRMLHGIR